MLVMAYKFKSIVCWKAYFHGKFKKIIRLNDDTALKLSTVDLCLMIVFGWAHLGSTMGFL